MLTLKKVNKALADLGHEERLFRGKGDRASSGSYYYFAEGDADRWPETAVYVHRVNDLSLAQWLAEHRRLREEWLKYR